MGQLRFVMLGGFLGAGKTTAIARLARHYMDRGQRVGVVTNDQAQDLVDTMSLRAQGFNVEEVAGACFCCRFNDLVEKVSELEKDKRPDVILAEPVGSCTDLVATVVQPLRDLYGQQFQVAPYPVLFKPSHGLRILRNESGSGFSPKAAYIFRKQLEEADAIVINRVDELSPTGLNSLTELVTSSFPGVPTLQMSAKTGKGFEALVELLDQQGNFGRKILDIDYDVYAAGEAELGWLNSSIRLRSDTPFDLDHFLLEVVANLRTALQPTGAEVAHLKAIGLWEGFFGVANLVSNENKPELSLASHCQVRDADLIVNARVAIDPADLQQLVQRVVGDVARSAQIQSEELQTQSFRPGRPTPTHRYEKAV